MASSYSISRRTFKRTMKLFFHLLDQTVLNGWILLSSHGTKYTHRDFRIHLVRNLIEEAGKSQDHPTPDWLEDQVRPQQMFCNSRVTITKTSQQNHPPNCTAGCVHFASTDRAQCISAPDVSWACAWCLVLQNIASE